MIRLPSKLMGKEVRKEVKKRAGKRKRRHHLEAESGSEDSVEKKEGVDGNKKVLHNLISLLQTKRFAAKRKKRSEGFRLIDRFGSKNRIQIFNN